MSQYQAVVLLSDLDGTNGFRINDYGASVSGAGDINGDGFDDVIVGSPFGNGACFVVFGEASGFGPTFDIFGIDGNNGFRIGEEVLGDRVGWSVSSAGDMDGDGYDDLIIGAPNALTTDSETGKSYVIFGKVAFDPAFDLSSLDGNNGFQIWGEAGGDHSGYSVSEAGDVNGDGFDDVIIGAPDADFDEPGSGTCWVVFGKMTGWNAAIALSTLDGHDGFQIDGPAFFSVDGHSGFTVSGAGDVNGDGFDDFAIGGDWDGYVVFGRGSFPGTIDLSGLDGVNGFAFDSYLDDYDSIGVAVSGAGDFNGDGSADVIVGIRFKEEDYNNYSGESYVVFGKASGFSDDYFLDELNGTDGFRIVGESGEDLSGYSVSSAGDVNGDGFDDLIVGAIGGESNGAAYVVFGHAAGPGGFAAQMSLLSLDGNNGFKIEGTWGTSVSAAGDMNKDGFDDIIVKGSYVSGPDIVSGSHVIFGSMPGEAVTRAGTAFDNDIHGGNLNDVLVGRGGRDTLTGHDGDDTLKGDKGADRLDGGSGKDTLNGGKGADRFVYLAVADSTGVQFDTVTDANFAADRWTTPGPVTAIDADVDTGLLRKGHFNADLSAAVDSAHLDAHHAVLFTPDSGNQSGKIFLIVDVNGISGYQAGADLVVELKTPSNLASIDAGDFISAI